MKFISLLFCTAFLFAYSVTLQAQITYVNSIKTNNGSPVEMIISPDNKFAYCIIGTKEIQTYSRNIATGQLTFLSSITRMKDGEALYDITAMAISPDGRFIYLNGAFNIFIFSRDVVTGSIIPFQHLRNVYSTSILPATPCNIIVSKNNKSVYITGRENLAIYKRDALTGTLILLDTLENINNTAGGGYNISITLSAKEDLAFITGMHSISVYSRDTLTGMLFFKSRITATHSSKNESLAYAQQTVVTSDDRFLYTSTNWNGSGGLVVLSKDSVTDSLKVIQSFRNEIRPGFINMTSDNRLISISSGISFFGPGSTLFYEADSATGLLRYRSTYKNSYKYSLKQCIDKDNRFLYTCPSFSDSIYIHRFNLFLDSVVNICTGDSAVLRPWGNYSSFNWSSGSTASSIIVNTAGKYSVTVQDKGKNDFFDSIRVNIVPLPSVSLGRDSILFTNESITLSPGSGYLSYRWNTIKDTLNFLNIKNSNTYTGAQYYWVSVTDSFGCKGSDTLMILFSAKTQSEAINYTLHPNPFSFQTILVSDKILKGAALIFYDQSGRQVKIINNLNGQTFTINRENLLPGTYYMQLVQDKQRFTTQKIVVSD